LALKIRRDKPDKPFMALLTVRDSGTATLACLTH